ncbi:MAG: hypothetical protein PUE63_04710 [Lachnospiraceae bacterium]|jgi:hypothetical protein|nr:hypothetical protein [Lachnospiraceae bacterium]
MEELKYADENELQRRLKTLDREELVTWDVDDFYRMFKQCQYNGEACFTEKQALALVLGAARLQEASLLKKIS